MLFFRQAGRTDEATEALDAALLDVLGLDVAALLGLDREGLIAACGGEGALGAARRLAVADLLCEGASLWEGEGRFAEAAAGYARARWLYLAAADEPETALPFDYAARVARLEELEGRAEEAARWR